MFCFGKVNFSGVRLRPLFSYCNAMFFVAAAPVNINCFFLVFIFSSPFGYFSVYFFAVRFTIRFCSSKHLRLVARF